MLATTLMLLSAALTVGAENLHYPGHDLAIYVSRPQLRAPLLNVTHLKEDLVSPGYLFMAPYAHLEATSLGREYLPFQAGPHIYTNKGELVWSGSEFVDNRNSWDFRMTTFEGEQMFSFILDKDRKGVSATPDGAGIIMDTSYKVRRRILFSDVGDSVDIHEFNVIKGKSSLSVYAKREEKDISVLNMTSKKAFVYNNGFREVDIETGNITFQWQPMEHNMTVAESAIHVPEELGKHKWGYDCFHTNSVDKNDEGDYLVSMRYTSTIYKISGKTGDIIWRLGGKHSNFVQDFNFSSQHAARFHRVNESVTIINFLDNASDEADRQSKTSNTSSIKIVALYEHEQPMRATMLRHFDRPDGMLTQMRGQGQMLPNGGVLAAWSNQGYMSEFAPDGSTVLEARLLSHRFDSYRGYKFNFVGRPTEPPSMKTHAFGSELSATSMSSVFYVSWNGATEVDSWTFYGTNRRSVPYENLGTIKKSGFETTYISNHFWKYSYAEAIAANGTILGRSGIETIVLPVSNPHAVTLDEFSNDIAQPKQASTSAFVTSVSGIIGLIFGILISIAVIVGKRTNMLTTRMHIFGKPMDMLGKSMDIFGKPMDIFRRPLYNSLHNFDSAIEEGELEALRYEDHSDDESEEESGRYDIAAVEKK